MVRCISPIGRVDPSLHADRIRKLARDLDARIGAVAGEGSYDLTVEEDVLLNAADCDRARVMAIVERVVGRADLLERDLLDDDKQMSEFVADLRAEPGSTT
jgi:hypothetical protein